MLPLTQDFPSEIASSCFPSKKLAIPQKYTEALLEMQEFCLCDFSQETLAKTQELASKSGQYLIENLHKVHQKMIEAATTRRDGTLPSLANSLKLNQSLSYDSIVKPCSAVKDNPGFKREASQHPEISELEGFEGLTVLGADNQGIECTTQPSGKRLSNLTKSKVNMKLLQNYNCEIEKRKNSKGGITTAYICKYDNCNKEFTRTWSIIDHVRMHEGYKPYKCKHCERSYTQKGNLLKHMKRHTDPSLDHRRSYICEFCNKKYTEKYNLKTHQKKFHLNQLKQTKSEKDSAKLTVNS
ncbi:unnamed protein product [Moneuplotes crassus]|uniref:C2H2-type domain-containing protein n=1 Tax=Euplotes crassus TaxID=5936 RepID=A0AAD2CZT8_EUPCR|nr:unnamed protein product [Moneuplotes crassus]